VKDIGRVLRNADPLAREEGLPADAVSDMRRAIVAAAKEVPQPGWWPRPLLVGATVATMLIGGVAAGSRLLWRDAGTTTIQPATSSAAADSPRRQLQFATPGGTRIIWVFDPEFNP
jgi:hypothetical protein